MQAANRSTRPAAGIEGWGADRAPGLASGVACLSYLAAFPVRWKVVGVRGAAAWWAFVGPSVTAPTTPTKLAIRLASVAELGRLVRDPIGRPPDISCGARKAIFRRCAVSCTRRGEGEPPQTPRRAQQPRLGSPTRACHGNGAAISRRQQGRPSYSRSQTSLSRGRDIHLRVG
jgi:hypothetical protein